MTKHKFISWHKCLERHMNVWQKVPRNLKLWKTWLDFKCTETRVTSAETRSGSKAFFTVYKTVENAYKFILKVTCSNLSTQLFQYNMYGSSNRYWKNTRGESYSHLTPGVAGLDLPLAVELEDCVILLSKTHNHNWSFIPTMKRFPAVVNSDLITKRKSHCLFQLWRW